MGKIIDFQSGSKRNNRRKNLEKVNVSKGHMPEIKQTEEELLDALDEFLNDIQKK